jgi:endo-1,4-beta-D-glucanase Y
MAIYHFSGAYMLKKILFSLSLCAIVSHSAVNFPYPQEKSYGYGTINTTSANASATLKSKFIAFLSGFYENGTCKNNVPCGRIKFDNTSQTVSEGIGYGMLMMVYFSDNTTSYKDQFDRLWVYYNNWLNTNGLMHWKIDGFNNVAEQNAATDAEFDVALALAMAHYQFGDQKYLDDAKALIKKIREKEMDSDGLHKPGDMWNTKRNPSYVSPAAFEIFKEVEDATFWSKALTRNYTLLANNQNSTTGLPSDWCNSNGNPVDNNDFGYDASRAPWRWAWANAWYGHADVKTLLEKLAPWANGKTPANINGPLDVSTGNNKGNCCNNSTFLGPLANALSYSSSYQTKMNSFWDALMEKSNESYFNAAMQLITGLLASGNMPNLKAMSESSKLSSSSTPSSSSSATLSSSSINNTPILLPQIAHGLLFVYASDNAITLANLPAGAKVEVFDLRGRGVASNALTTDNTLAIPMQTKGIYIVKVSGISVLNTPNVFRVAVM